MAYYTPHHNMKTHLHHRHHLGETMLHLPVILAGAVSRLFHNTAQWFADNLWTESSDKTDTNDESQYKTWPYDPFDPFGPFGGL